MAVAVTVAVVFAVAVAVEARISQVSNYQFFDKKQKKRGEKVRPEWWK